MTIADDRVQLRLSLILSTLILLVVPILVNGEREPASPWDVPLEVVYQATGTGITIEHARCRLSGYGFLAAYELLGEVSNASDSTITGISVDAALLNPDEESISSDQATTALQMIAPGESAPFRISLRNAYGPVSACILNLSWTETATSPGRAVVLNLHPQTGYAGSRAGYIIVVIARNTSPQILQNVRIVFTGYGEDGVVVDFTCARGYEYECMDLTLPSCPLQEALQLLAPHEEIILEMRLVNAPSIVHSILGVAEYELIPPCPD
jgi:hypothetical protein